MTISSPGRLFGLLLACLGLMAGSAVAQDLYRVQAGDTLRIEVIEDPSLNRSVLVAPDGRINIPLAGFIVAEGRPVGAIQNDLALRLEENFAVTPNVFVAVERVFEPRIEPPAQPAAPRTIDVYVLGEVGAPGLKTVAPGTTVLQFFAQMGGFTRFAATKRVQLRRTDASGTETIYPLNYDAIEAGTSPNGAAVLVDGDVIMVPQRRLFE
ncbi:polysaccharide export protein [Ponticoccus sp. SC2-23]|uniref:polysaccharide biosynthesis/export family protein n=1 Tax=Alexandriicola marinus TaxID=2081710 RepID=UPI000FD723CE|nr:polysaccharide biosynthesis/export family protein [Alexandriicola marinus]MBM1222519.1 polysaccharide export protein [Ponticoccus sp. SC6-9]MBM1227025.1 polysaccharide export protein [Ponticoccus sp. SC6-15]MBM1231446.1 polysaccharide export protein [Ponticoccus sp. SC6-38]MBM1236019.1 polysaccharide export protein [Ponticoccus sp. SC6-45]MBM1240469.1 polysaccharide export protein [Ponticoccus sp. SC6-49]MBM1245004.1 polysaccharide export protein [Ponticoccus sp. SC2-64]MBM1249493.1 polys